MIAPGHVLKTSVGRYLYNREYSLIGVLRGLEHRDSVYSDILELALDTEGNESTANLRYRVSGDRRETADDFTDSCLQTALRVVEYTVETMSHPDFDHPMSDIMELTENRPSVLPNRREQRS